MFAHISRVRNSAIYHSVRQSGYGVIGAIILIVLFVWVVYYAWLIFQTGAESETDQRVITSNNIITTPAVAYRAPEKASEAPEKPINKTTQAKSYEEIHSPSELITLLSKYSYLSSNRPSLYMPAEGLDKHINALIAHGRAAIPSIREFLRSGHDLDFSEARLSKQTGYDSLRLALFDVLYRIGAPESESVWYEALHSTSNPAEIAALASYLNEYAPDKYRHDIIATAQDAFALVSDSGIEGRDAGPVFQVFQDYGDASLVADLEQLSQLRWGQYASVTLANLPDGTGISSLVRIADGAPQQNLGARFALQMLAQSAEHPEAQTALVNSVRANQIPDYLWPQYAQTIAGIYQIQIPEPVNSMARSSQGSAQIYISSVKKITSFTPGGGQVMYGVSYQSPLLTIEQMETRLELIDTLLSETSNPAASRALEQAYYQVWNSYIKNINP